MTAPVTTLRDANARAWSRAENVFAQPIDRKYTPFEGPQTAFDESTEFEVLYGGAKGPGKSHALLYKPLRWIHRALCKVLFLRVDFPSLQENMDRADREFPKFGAVWNERDRRWTFPSGAKYEFGYAESMKDVRRYAGREPSIICYDQLEQLALEKVWTTLLAEIRSPDPAIVRQALGSANPDGPGEFWLISRFVKPCGEDGQKVYRDPHEPEMTRRFIPGKVTDNPIYAKDTKYMSVLRSLPKRQRDQKLHGKWGLGTGRGLDELTERIHVIPPFEVPKHWTVWGGYDWGFGHPFAFGWFAQDEDGTVYLVDSTHGHKQLPWQQAEQIKARAPERYRTLVYAGHDCWAERKAEDNQNPKTIAKTFEEHGIALRKAILDRVQGLNNIRDYIKWQGPEDPVTGEVEIWRPRFFIMDTPANQTVFTTLQSMMLDPEYPEDVLKRDADSDTGENGDDDYDMVRYALMARPSKTRALPDPDLDAFSPAALAATVEQTMKLGNRRARQKRSAGHDHGGY